ncbi:MAG: ester cyclase [Thermoanaerobaculia bacterium]
MPDLLPPRASSRLAVVEEHVRCENRHDLPGLLATFGAGARYDDEPWDDHRLGLDGVRAYYAELLAALPDLEIEVRSRHVGQEAIVLEVTIRGTHLGPWRGGMPATGRRVEFPLCGVFTFDADDRMAGERIYYDRATVLRQIGLFREPVGPLGRLASALGHPLTVARALLRRGALSRSRPPPVPRA